MNTIITLGAGCFWCLESALNNTKGIISATSGYMGGHTEAPTYKDICTGQTGHAEVVRVEFDPKIITLEQVLTIFWTMHNPTQLNRQGNDVGTQYRSVIFYNIETQVATIHTSIEEVAKDIWGDNIVTQVLPEEQFYPAEAYHQGYYNNNPNQGYCLYVVGPKLQKFRSTFSHLLKEA